MLIICFLLGLSVATAQSLDEIPDQILDTEVQNINLDNEKVPDSQSEVPDIQSEVPDTQREKRFVTGYFVPQNNTGHASWGNMNIKRNNITTHESNNYNRKFVANVTRFMNNGTRPSGYNGVLYPGNPGYVAPQNATKNTPNSSGHYIYPKTIYVKPIEPVMVYPIQNYSMNGTTPGFSFNTTINQKPNNNFTYPYGAMTAPPTQPYPGFNSGYPAPNAGYNNVNLVPATNTTAYAPRPINRRFNMTLPYASGRNGTGYNSNGNACNRCKIARNDSTVTVKKMTMDTCAILCSGCPTGTRRVGTMCVTDLDYDY